MSALLKDALDNWKAIRNHLEDTEDMCDEFELTESRAQIASVSDTLEAAQQEAEAWEMIERWAGVHRVCSLERAPSRNNLPVSWRCYSQGPRIDSAGMPSIFGATRLEALTKAAAWCRSELAK